MGHEGVGWGGSCGGGVGHEVVGWGWGGLCRCGVGHEGVGWVGVGHVGWGGSCRGGVAYVGVGWVMQGWGGVAYGVGWGGMGHYKGKHDYKMHIYHDHKKLQILHNVTTKQGSRNIKGADLCLAYDMGGGGNGAHSSCRHAALWLFHWIIESAYPFHQNLRSSYDIRELVFCYPCIVLQMERICYIQKLDLCT